MLAQHLPVLLGEVLSLVPPTTKNFADFTLGLGGHSIAILKNYPNAHLWGFDRDASALDLAEKRLQEFSGRIHLSALASPDAVDYLKEQKICPEFSMADLGVSSYQIDTPQRGFSFYAEGPLDMRMDARQTTTAADLIASLNQEELAQIFKVYGEEPFAKLIATAIVQARAHTPISSTRSLAELIEAKIPYHLRKRKKIHPATLVFQALRLKVNDELPMLKVWLGKMATMACPLSRLAVISFHSLEDRLVKQTFHHWALGCTCPPNMPICVCGKVQSAKILFKKAIQAAEKEVAANSRARSARLRAVEFL